MPKPKIVAPLVGAWIEIATHNHGPRSEPVAPLVGAWIEIWLFVCYTPTGNVAPLVGAWIEIPKGNPHMPASASLLSWERGLKYIIINQCG